MNKNSMVTKRLLGRQNTRSHNNFDDCS